VLLWNTFQSSYFWFDPATCYQLAQGGFTLILPPVGAGGVHFDPATCYQLAQGGFNFDPATCYQLEQGGFNFDPATCYQLAQGWITLCGCGSMWFDVLSLVGQSC